MPLATKLAYTCVNACKFPIHQCPNMQPKENDTDMNYEHYECKVCGKTDYLDYEEMK